MNAAWWLLTPLSLLYGGVIRVRNFYYDHVPGTVRRAALPVISVGNLTVGGTGKTPMVIEVVRRLGALGRRPVILTRGYGADAGETADEVLEFHDAVPNVPVVVNPDRAAGATTAQREHGADCLVLDDGFQHRRLARDLDIVLVDALQPWGGGWLLPAGRLREPLSCLRRADLILITRANQVDPPVVDAIRADLRRYGQNEAVLTAAVEADALVFRDGRRAPAGELAARRVLPVCGIGNPRSFGQMIHSVLGRPADAGARAIHFSEPAAPARNLSEPEAQARGRSELAAQAGDQPAADTFIFPDHHRYSSADVDSIRRRALQNGAELVVTTRKDWVKLAPLWPAGGVELARLDVRLILQGGAEFDARLRQIVEKQQ